MDQPDLRSAEHYINRELSLLEFNERVLAQALDEKYRCSSACKFLCISSNNLDEFFEIRVAGLKQRIELGSRSAGPRWPDHHRAAAGDSRSRARLVDAQYACLNDVLLPALRHQGIELLARAHLGRGDRALARKVFRARSRAGAFARSASIPRGRFRASRTRA